MAHFKKNTYHGLNELVGPIRMDTFKHFLGNSEHVRTSFLIFIERHSAPILDAITHRRRYFKTRQDIRSNSKKLGKRNLETIYQIKLLFESRQMHLFGCRRSRPPIEEKLNSFNLVYFLLKQQHQQCRNLFLIGIVRYQNNGFIPIVYKLKSCRKHFLVLANLLIIHLTL